MIGWRGEIFYLGGAGDAVESLYLDNCRFLTTDGSAFNPGVNVAITARGCTFGDAYQAQEDTGKSHAHYRDCTWRDCNHTGIGSGATAGFEHHFAWPTRDDAATMPLTQIDNGVFRDAGQLYVSSWVAGNIRTIDTQVVVDASFSLAPRDVDLTIAAWLDRADAVMPLAIHGPASFDLPVPGAPPGVYSQPPRAMRFSVDYRRTELAAREGRHWRGPYGAVLFTIVAASSAAGNTIPAMRPTAVSSRCPCLW